MTATKPAFLLLSAFLLVASATNGQEPAVSGAGISERAKKNFTVIDALDVADHWPAGVHVAWKSGVPDGRPEKTPGKHTHCSAFAAAAADALGIYLLHPPEHGQILLANAQADWLPSAAGQGAGSAPLADGEAAQRAANAGRFVVAVYKNRNPKVPGHIAVVRPSTKSAAAVASEGPEITQAGLNNYADTTLDHGFAGHRIALREHLVKFFAHDVRD